MPEIKRKWDRLSEEERATAKQELIDFFAVERDQKIGLVAAEEILNFFLQTVGPVLYNKGVTDAKKLLTDRTEDLQYELDALLDM